MVLTWLKIALRWLKLVPKTPKMAPKGLPSPPKVTSKWIQDAFPNVKKKYGRQILFKVWEPLNVSHVGELWNKVYLVLDKI